MKGYIANIEDLTKENNNFRKVLYTSKYSQLVLMSLKPGEEIGEEVHNNIDQFFRIESGQGKVIIDGVENMVEDDFAVIVPAGASHNVINTSSDEPLKLYTIYSPPEHKDEIIHQTKEDALADENDHFDGRTSE
jgi:mannose-6-phosphate isomerase-like protein (cupin superfamily)